MNSLHQSIGFIVLGLNLLTLASAFIENRFIDNYIMFLFQGGENNQFILDAFLTTYFNIARTGKHNQDLRDAGLIPLLLPVLKSEMNAYSLLALATLAELVNEQEANSLNADGNSIKNLIDAFQQALSSEDGRSSEEWSSWGLARGTVCFLFNGFRHQYFLKAYMKSYILPQTAAIYFFSIEPSSKTGYWLRICHG